jgi:pimeloyl-ACP methyl ester carboxylesterase
MDTGLLILLIALCLVAAIPLANAVFALIANRRHPPCGRFIEVDGLRLHYIERGQPDAMPMVLLHGNGLMLQDFVLSGVIERAARKYRVVCFDRPGFGHSTRPRKRAWTPEAQAESFVSALKRLRIERPIVMGHSWGTQVALAMALRAPTEVQGLILAAGYYFPTWRNDVWLLSGPAVPLIGDVLRYTVAPLLSWFMLPKLLETLFAPRAVPDEFWQKLPRSLCCRPSQLRAAAEEAALMVPAAARLARRYADLAVPVALISGAEDRVVRSEQAVRLQQTLPRATHRRVPKTGHMVHYADPDQLIDAADLMAHWPPPIARDGSRRPLAS